jgi:hypothetical protein
MIGSDTPGLIETVRHDNNKPTTAMKYITALILLLSTTFAFSDVAGLLTKETRSWQFVQSVGGMKVSVKDTNLVVDCDVSGLRKVTVEPTMVNSGIGVDKLKHKRDGNTISLTLVTRMIGKGVSTSPKPIDLAAYADGEYSIEYLDPDGTKHALAKVTLQRKKNGEQGGGGQPATRPESKEPS